MCEEKEITVSEWTESLERPGYRMKVIQLPNCTVRVFRPILDPAERARREAYVTAVCESVLSSYYRRMEEKKREQN